MATGAPVRHGGPQGLQLFSRPQTSDEPAGHLRALRASGVLRVQRRALHEARLEHLRQRTSGWSLRMLHPGTTE